MRRILRPQCWTIGQFQRVRNGKWEGIPFPRFFPEIATDPPPQGRSLTEEPCQDLASDSQRRDIITVVQAVGGLGEYQVGSCRPTP